MTEAQVSNLSALRELLEQRTPGQWQAQPFDRQPDLAVLVSWEELADTGRRSRRAKMPVLKRHHVAGFFRTADAHLVELAINALPNLLDDYERLLRRQSAIDHSQGDEDMTLTDLLKGLNLNRRQFMELADFERIKECLSGDDLKAQKILEEVIFQLEKRGVSGENLVGMLAAFHQLGFRGQALVEAFESNHYDFERTYLRGVFALIRSEFPFIKDPFVAPTEAE